MLDALPLGSLYMVASIFGIGVLVIDFLGLLGEHDHDDAGGHDDAGLADHADGHIADHDDGGVADHAGHVADHADDGADHTDADHDGDHEDGPDHSHFHGETSGILVLSILRHLRSVVYFSAGFGPVGLLATWKSYGALGSLAWSAPCGIASLVIVRAILRIQRKDTDSTIKAQDILMRKATVIVPIEKDGMGKVRIVMDQLVQEQYALPEHDDERFKSGDEVYVTNVTEDCVYVESEARFESDASAKLDKLE